MAAQQGIITFPYVINTVPGDIWPRSPLSSTQGTRDWHVLARIEPGPPQSFIKSLRLYTCILIGNWERNLQLRTQLLLRILFYIMYGLGKVQWTKGTSCQLCNERISISFIIASRWSEGKRLQTLMGSHRMEAKLKISTPLPLIRSRTASLISTDSTFNMYFYFSCYKDAPA